MRSHTLFFGAVRMLRGMWRLSENERKRNLKGGCEPDRLRRTGMPLFRMGKIGLSNRVRIWYNGREEHLAVQRKEGFI